MLKNSFTKTELDVIVADLISSIRSDPLPGSGCATIPNLYNTVAEHVARIMTMQAKLYLSYMMNLERSTRNWYDQNTRTAQRMMDELCHVLWLLKHMPVPGNPLQVGTDPWWPDEWAQYPLAQQGPVFGPLVLTPKMHEPDTQLVEALGQLGTALMGDPASEQVTASLNRLVTLVARWVIAAGILVEAHARPDDEKGNAS